MTHHPRHIPFGDPLVSGCVSPDCRAVVIIPARNEELILPRTLDALRTQREIQSSAYEVILLLNNCTDASETVALAYQAIYPTFQLHVATCELAPDKAHVGTARRQLMDTAYHRLQLCTHPHPAILSTDADTVVASDWVARNLLALEAGADVVGGVIHLFPDDLKNLRTKSPGVYRAYCNDREFQAHVAQLESLLDPDPVDPWPRHLEHFGASLACTPAIYALSGGLPPVKPLEDVAFIDALRKVGARIRHAPDVHIFTSARLDGRAEIGLSGQLRHWRRETEQDIVHLVDSPEWLEHRFRSMADLRSINQLDQISSLTNYPTEWHERLQKLHAERLPTPRFLELLDCDALIDQTFPVHAPRHVEITRALKKLALLTASLSTEAVLMTR